MHCARVGLRAERIHLSRVADVWMPSETNDEAWIRETQARFSGSPRTRRQSLGPRVYTRCGSPLFPAADVSTRARSPFPKRRPAGHTSAVQHEIHRLQSARSQQTGGPHASEPSPKQRARRYRSERTRRSRQRSSAACGSAILTSKRQPQSLRLVASVPTGPSSGRGSYVR